MKNVFACLLFASIAVASAPASADPIDVSTVSCQRLASAYESKTKDDISFINGILNWMGGYHATEEQGTVVDWSKLSKAFDETVAFCATHPGVGVMSASEKFMGEHIAEASAQSYDLSIVTCETALTDEKLRDNIGDTFMWLAGYHASSEDESTMFDVDKFVAQVGQIADYCKAHPKDGLVTASEKFMSESE